MCSNDKGFPCLFAQVGDQFQHILAVFGVQVACWLVSDYKGWIGGQSTRFGGRLFGGLGIPLPIGHGIVVVPSAGFTQEPKTSVNLNTLLNAALYQCEAASACNPASYPLMSSHIPTTLDYAVRVTQKDKPHFAIDIGVGQVAGNIGSIYVANPFFNPSVPANGPPVVTTPVNLQARSVFGMGLSYRY